MPQILIYLSGTCISIHLPIYIKQNCPHYLSTKKVSFQDEFHFSPDNR